MRESGDGSPRITVWGVPIRWPCQDLRRDAHVSQETAWSFASPARQRPLEQLTVSQLSARLHHCCSTAKPKPDGFAILSEALSCYLGLIPTGAEAQQPTDPASIGPLRDPLRPKFPGRPEAHPSRRSSLFRKMGSTNWTSEALHARHPERRKVYPCGICAQIGHNAKTCGAKLP
jgi:hypothetical protein